MKWSESEFMEFVQKLLHNYFLNEKENGSNKYDKRIEDFEKFGYKTENYEENILKNGMYAIGHYFKLTASQVGEALNWTWNKLKGEVDKFLDEKVMWVAKNPEACEDCKDLDGKVFKIRNLPITHPNCRCGITKADDNIVESDMSKTKKDFYGRPRNTKRVKYKEIYYGDDGRAIKETHWTDHGRPDQHSAPTNTL